MDLWESSCKMRFDLQKSHTHTIVFLPSEKCSNRSFFFRRVKFASNDASFSQNQNFFFLSSPRTFFESLNHQSCHFFGHFFFFNLQWSDYEISTFLCHRVKIRSKYEIMNNVFFVFVEFVTWSSIQEHLFGDPIGGKSLHFCRHPTRPEKCAPFVVFFSLDSKFPRWPQSSSAVNCFSVCRNVISLLCLSHCGGFFALGALMLSLIIHGETWSTVRTPFFFLNYHVSLLKEHTLFFFLCNIWGFCFLPFHLSFCQNDAHPNDSFAGWACRQEKAAARLFSWLAGEHHFC